VTKVAGEVLMAKYKVVITDREYADIDNEKRIFTAIDAEVLDYQYKDSDDILRAAHDADAIMVQYAQITA
jgi:D-3-phosphoglycerate dehydrogenase